MYNPSYGKSLATFSHATGGNWTQALEGLTSRLTHNVTDPIGPETSRILTGPSNFSFTEQEKTLHKIHLQHSFLFILSSFISKKFGNILEGKPVNKNVPKC